MQEQGRSMIEMLGVLVIIGVLSFGAIIGYSYAMDKYRANETIRDITSREMYLYNNDNLSEWENEKTIYPITLVEGESIGLQVTGVPRRVCQIVFDELIPSATIEISGKKYTVRTKDVCDDENAMIFYFNSLMYEDICNPVCETEEYCVAGICMKGGFPEIDKEFNACSSQAECSVCQSCSGGVCRATGHINGTVCPLDNGEKGLCVFGECTKTGCDSNSDCQIKEYCASPNTGVIQFPKENSGACAPVDFVRVEFKVNGKKEVWYASNSTMSWFDAKSACDAINKKMIGSVNDLIDSWDGKTGKQTRNERAVMMREAIGGFYAWTSQVHDKNTVYSVGLSSGSVAYNFKYYDYDYNIAVCN